MLYDLPTTDPISPPFLNFTDLRCINTSQPATLIYFAAMVFGIQKEFRRNSGVGSRIIVA
jgi:hypothetical protein